VIEVLLETGLSVFTDDSLHSIGRWDSLRRPPKTVIKSKTDKSCS